MIFRTRALAARLAVALLFVFSGAQAMAAGALAIDSLQGEKYGFSFNHPSADQAEQRALRECGQDCGVVLRFRAECAAYAADQARGSNAYGWGTGATSAAVQQRAISECRNKGGSSCKVRSWGCDATKASAEPEARPDSVAEFQMLGRWQVDYAGSAGFPYRGTLQVDDKLGKGVFGGVLVLAYTTNEGQSKKVQQDVRITVRGNTVVLKGSNPVYLQGAGNYSPDTYTVSIEGPRSLRGENNDAGGAGGAVVITRR